MTTLPMRRCASYHRRALPKVIKGSPGGPSSPTPQGGVRSSAPALIPNSKGPGPKILEKEVVGAHAEAKKMMADAMQQREHILQRAQVDANSKREQGYQEGYQE